MSTLVIAEHDNKVLKGATLNAVAAAQKIGAPVTVLVAGNDCKDATAAAAQVAGVSKVLVADAVQYRGRPWRCRPPCWPCALRKRPSTCWSARP
jgi:electron transfer flavoprotein alpha subunit